MLREGERPSAEGERDFTLLSMQLMLPSLPFGMVHRHRLVERLRSGLRQPLTLVAAPAGSGKTALIASTAALSEDPVAWASLEPGDDDPARFWSVVLGALRNAGAAPDGSPLAALAPPLQSSYEQFVPLFVNAVAELPRRVVLVLDDLHAVRSRECLAQLSFLVLHTPPTLGLVLSARSDPVLPLHVPRLSGHLCELRTRDLAFTVEETAELLEAHGLELPEEEVAVLCECAEGWAAGLKLAALSLRGHSDPARFIHEFAGDERAVGDYLIAEVLDRQPAKLRAFLLRTSIVDTLCGELADAITGETTGADVLAGLERSNGFVLGLDARRCWYRYHRLFAQLLRARAQRELGSTMNQLHHRAARWYAEHDLPSEALQHAVAAGDWDLAVELTAEHWFELFVRGHGGTIRSLLDALPPDRLDADAEVAAVLACTALEVGDVAAADAHLAHADAASATLPEARRRRYVETIAVAALLRARIEGDFDAALTAADAVLAQAGAWSSERRRALVHAQLGATALWAHRLVRAEEELRSAAVLARSCGLDHLLVTVLSDLALLEWMVDGCRAEQASAREALTLAQERGWLGIPQTAPAHAACALSAFFDLRPQEAEEHLRHGLAAIERVDARQIEFVLIHLYARMQGWVGRPDEGLRALDRYVLAHDRGGTPRYERASILSMRAHLIALQGDLPAARAALEPLGDQPWMVVTIARARLELADGDPDLAVDLLEDLSGSEPTHAGTTVEAAVLLAIAHDRANDPARAAAATERALALAEATGHRWPFVEAGRRMEMLLRHQIRHGTAHRAIAGELIDAVTARDPVSTSVAPLLEPLSTREQAILRFLPTRLSNREIADELFVTTNTVKTHLRSIYRKLDVARRREAVERAHALRLLSNSGR